MSCILLQIGRVMAGGGVMLRAKERRDGVMDRKRAWRGRRKRRCREQQIKRPHRCVFLKAGVGGRGVRGGCHDDGLPLQRQRHSSSLERHGEICRLASTS